MKVIARLFVLLFVLVFTNTSFAKKIKANFSYYTFNTPDAKPYIETNISILASSVNFTKIANGKFQASVKVRVRFYIQKEELKSQETYNLLSTIVADTSKLQFQFIDQKRYPLGNGDYTIKLSLSDNNDSLNTVSLKEDFKIDFPAELISFSDIALLESYTKEQNNSVYSRNGYTLTPMVDNFYPTNIHQLKFYNEIYNTQILAPNEQFLLSYYLEFDGGAKLNTFIQQQKISAKNVIINLGEFDITELQSGNYNLVIELRNKMNEVIAYKKCYFQRSNKSLGKDLEAVTSLTINNSFAANYTLSQMKDHIACLKPISTQNELAYEKTLLANLELNQMKQFLVYFWTKRNPADAANAWSNYELEVQKVNNSYGSKINKGYDTDRGYIYLKYGAPNVVRTSDMNVRAFPYEIWRFYKIGTFSNKRFVFFSPDNLKNEMVLLHSDMFGERYDPQWKYKILSRSMKNNPDEVDPNSDDTFGDKLDADYND